jgi:zinc transporter ZupT
MSVHDALSGAVAIVFISLMFYLPKKFSLRNRLIASAVLAVAGWAGIFGALALGNTPMMRNVVVVYLWLGTAGVMIVLSIALFVPAFREWRRSRKSRRGRRERWPNV